MMDQVKQHSPVILEDVVDRELSIKEAAAATGWTTASVSKWVSDKDLPARKDERSRWKIKQSDLDKFMANKKVKPRRNAQVAKYDQDEEPPTSLFTQLDQAHAQIAELQAALATKEQTISKVETGQVAELTQLKIKVSEQEKELDLYEERAIELKDQVKEQAQMLAKYQDFMFQFVSETMRSITGSPTPTNSD